MADSNVESIEDLQRAIADLQRRVQEARGLHVSGSGAIAMNGGLAGGARSAVIRW